MTLQQGDDIAKLVGIVAGYPAMLWLERDKEEDTLGVYLSIECLWKKEEALERGPALGVVLRYEFHVGRCAGIELKSFFTSRSYDGYSDVFKKPWAEVVREGSPHFPGGKLEVKVTVKLAV